MAKSMIVSLYFMLLPVFVDFYGFARTHLAVLFFHGLALVVLHSFEHTLSILAALLLGFLILVWLGFGSGLVRVWLFLPTLLLLLILLALVFLLVLVALLLLVLLVLLIAVAATALLLLLLLSLLQHLHGIA